MISRIITAAICLPVFVGLMFWEQLLWFRLFMAAAILMAWLEYRAMAAKARGSKPSATLGIAFIGLYLYSLVLDAQAGGESFALTREALVVIYFFAVAFRQVLREDERHGLESFLLEFGGGLYIGVLGSYLFRLHYLEEGARWFLLVFFFAWIYDSGAYFTGKTLGKRPFSKWSPNKTWEGFIGGLIAVTVLSGWLVPRLVQAPGLDMFRAAGLGLVAGIMAQLGDLFESILKRSAGVKDTGTLMGEHGGVLDKMDSSLFVAPLVFYAALLWAAP